MRDNRVQGKEKQATVMANTEQEIVTVEKQAAMEAQQVQTTNKFAILEVENSDVNENNQIVLVEDNSA